MAKQVSNIKVQGTVDGITYYQRNGKNFARVHNGPSKSLMATHPNFESLRNNMKEFGGSMRPVSGFRAGFEKVGGTMFDKSISKRLSKIFRTMINRHPGARGKRPVEIIPNKDLLEGFELSDNLWLSDVFKGVGNFSINAARNEVTLTIDPFIPVHEIKRPSFATHFEIVNHISILSNYEFDEEEKGYMPIDNVNNSKYATVSSAVLPLSEASVDNLTIMATLTNLESLDPTSAVIASLGIRFFEERGGNRYPLGTGGAMKVKQIF